MLWQTPPRGRPIPEFSSVLDCPPLSQATNPLNLTPTKQISSDRRLTCPVRMGTLENTSSAKTAQMATACSQSTHQLEGPPWLQTTDLAQTGLHPKVASPSDPRATYREEQRTLRREMRQNGAKFYTDRLTERRQEARTKRKATRQLPLGVSAKRGRGVDAKTLLKQMSDMATEESKAQMMEVLGSMKPKKANNSMPPIFGAKIMGGGHDEPVHLSHLCLAEAVPRPVIVENVGDFSPACSAPAALL